MDQEHDRNSKEQARVSPRFQDPRQERIQKLLQLIGPGPAAFYRDICRLMDNNSGLESVTHLVGHLFREIESALRDVMESIIPDFQNKIRSIKGDRHNKEIVLILRALNISEDHPIANVWKRMAGDNEYNLHSKAHRHHLEGPRKIDILTRSYWRDIESVFEFVLEKFRENFLQVNEFLDSLKEIETPTRKDAEQLRAKCPYNQVTHYYFFKDLDNPKWLKLLHEKDFFNNPPKREYVDEESYTIPFWPEAQYLARVANNEPELAIEIITKIPTTDNYRVHRDLLEALVNIPPESTTKAETQVIKWIHSSNHLWFADDFGKVIVHLAIGDQIESALMIARALLELLPDQRKGITKELEESLLGIRPEPSSRFDNWEYGKLLEEIVPILAEKGKDKTLLLFCELLERALKLSIKKIEDEKEWGYEGPRAIENHEQNQVNNKPIDKIVFNIRNIAKSLIDQQGKLILDIIESKDALVFKRISLHLRIECSDVDLEGTKKIISDPGIFDNTKLYHEMYHLLKALFHKMPREVQSVYFDHIEKGREKEKVELKRIYISLRDKIPEDEEIEKNCRNWEYEKLYPIQKALSDWPEWLKRFDELKKEFKEKAHPDFTRYISSGEWVHPKTPKNKEELCSMSIVELTDYLKSYEVTDDPMDLSIEGLGAEVKALVSEEPLKYIPSAECFRCVQPAYIRSYLLGVQEAIKQGTELDEALWDSVLTLCKWVVEQPRDTQIRKGRYSDLDPNWGWSRRTIGQLLEEGFKAKTHEIPFALREKLWSVLLPLTDDPDPNEEKDSESSDPATTSINSVRGIAMHTVVYYALWSIQNIKKEPNGKEKVEKEGFGVIPEVKKVLERHLEQEYDNSFTIRSVYGQWFPWLVGIDKNWAKKNKDKIFSKDEEKQPYFDIAWETYITFCHPYTDVYQLLMNDYVIAIERIGTWPERQSLVGDPDVCLANHLMIYYGRCQINLDDSDNLIKRFFDKAPDAIRASAIETCGELLQKTPLIRLSEFMLEKLQNLWNWRIAVAEKSEPISNHKEELKSFGYWFASGKGDDTWMLSQLQRVLSLVKEVVPEHLVIERLAVLSPSYPAAAIQCLNLMIEGDVEGWKTSSWKKSATTIFSTALANEEAKASARSTINRLAARGNYEFRDLLS